MEVFMIKNNLLIQLVNLIIINLSFILFLAFIIVFNLNFKTSSLIIFVTSMVCYGLLTYLLIDPYDYYLDNIKSILSLPLISLTLFALYFILNISIDNYVLSIPFESYNFYCTPLMNFLDIFNPVTCILFSIIPFIICLLAITLKPKKQITNKK